jgi:hypothetical protein
MVSGRKCQSCGMPLFSDVNGGGTEEDGRKTFVYCSGCYQMGKFMEPDLTVDEMIEEVRVKMKANKVPIFVSNKITNDIPNLKRWSK